MTGNDGSGHYRSYARAHKAANKKSRHKASSVIEGAGKDSAIAPVPAKLKRPAEAPPLCKLTGQVDKKGRVGMKIDQAPGALLAVFGSREPDQDFPSAPPAFVDRAITDLVNVALAGVLIGDKKLSAGEVRTEPVNSMLQAMAAFEPQNEVEGMIAIQAVALHHVTMDSLARASRCDRADIRSMNLSMANKSARTFATLLEALNRHRGKVTTQKVIVENVTVEAGGQAVVGAVLGEGASKKGGVQPHG